MRRAYDEKYRFLSTPSARRATAWSFATRSPTIISIHVLREEGDLSPCAALLLRLEFLSTPSARRATTERPAIGRHGKNFYPRPPRGGRRPRLRCQNQTRAISIHALREEGDLALVVADAGDVPISIHALREEGDVILMYLLTITSVFLSTPSARRATVRPARIVISTMYFYPRPPRGGRLLLVVSPGRRCTFLSTPSARRATVP